MNKAVCKKMICVAMYLTYITNQTENKIIAPGVASLNGQTILPFAFQGKEY